MSTLNFKCLKIDENGEECGRRFFTEKELETHIKSRHPELINNVRKEKKLLDFLLILEQQTQSLICSNKKKKKK